MKHCMAMNHNKIGFYYDLGAFILLAVPVSMFIFKLFGYELFPLGMLSVDRKILALIFAITPIFYL